MTREQEKAKFQTYWQGKAKDPTSIDDDENYCPNKLIMCDKCPIKWPGEMCVINTETILSTGLIVQYDEAIESGNTAKAAEIARQIADLPWINE